jgi:metal-responsive CopG/Arc/MetJ family transcriptional regulator
MARLNLTLDEDTFRRLDRHTRSQGKPRAKVATEILREGLGRREALEQRKRLARDYAAGRADARELLADLESPQIELAGDEDDA